MNAMTTNATEFYNTHRWVVSDTFYNRDVAYFATEELALADVGERFGWNYRVIHMDDLQCQKAAERELGRLLWGPVRFVDGIEVASDLMRDWHRGLRSWKEVIAQHRNRVTRTASA